MSSSPVSAETMAQDRPHTPEPTDHNTSKRTVIDTPRRTVVLHYLNDKENEHSIKWIADETKMSTSSVLKIKKEGSARRPSSLQAQAKAQADAKSNKNKASSGKITKTKKPVDSRLKLSDEKIDKIIETLAVEDPDKEMTWAQIIKRFRLNIGVAQFGRRMNEHGFSREGHSATWIWMPSPFGGMRKMNPRAHLIVPRKYV